MSALGERVRPPRNLSLPPVRGRTGWALALAAAAATGLWLAADAGVTGPAAVPDVARALLAALLVFGLCGYAAARLVLPPALQSTWPLWVLPLGAATSTLALTVLGFAHVPYRPALVAVLAAGALTAIATHRRRPRTGAGAAGWDRALLPLALVGALIVCLALLPTFRSGLATVTGTGADAHQVAGYATFVQHNTPGDYAPEYPLDFVRYEWGSKYPMFYGVAAVASVAGLEPWQAMMTVGALLLAVAAAGFFLVARALGAGLAAGTLAMGLAGLDRQVLHVAMHPYHGQGWGLATLPFAVVLAVEAVRGRSARALVPLGLLLLLGGLAYPLMLPFPLLAIAAAWLVVRRDAKARGEPAPPLDPRRLWRGPMSLLWIVPLVVVLLRPVTAVLEKLLEFNRLLFNLDTALPDWRGDVEEYAVLGEFFGVPRLWMPLAVVSLAAVGAAAVYGLARGPRVFGLTIAIVVAPALACAGLFRALTGGEYIYFKILSFAGPFVLVAAVVGLACLAGRGQRVVRWAAGAALVALAVGATVNVRREVSRTYDQLTPEQIELREWSKRLPAGASVRLDTFPRTHLWDAYFLSDRPVGSRRPNLFYWHVPYTRGADYALTRAGSEPRAGRVGPPVFENARRQLWRLSPDFGRDTTSRRQFSYLGALKRGDPRLRRIFRRGIPDPTR